MHSETHPIERASVEQADRILAAYLHKCIWGTAPGDAADGHARLLSGERDDEFMIQAIANYRLAQGWVVMSGDGKRFRTWKYGWSAWTDDREQAARYARRQDAEAVHAEDEDAWFVRPYGDMR